MSLRFNPFPIKGQVVSDKIGQVMGRHDYYDEENCVLTCSAGKPLSVCSRYVPSSYLLVISIPVCQNLCLCRRWFESVKSVCSRT